MISALELFKNQALQRPGVQEAYGELNEEFTALDQALNARAEQDVPQDRLPKLNLNSLPRAAHAAGQLPFLLRQKR